MLTVQLSPAVEAEIGRLVASGGYADAGKVNEKAVRLLAERERKLRWLRDELAIGEAQERRGEVAEMTRERFERITRQAIEDADSGKSIKDSVSPKSDA